MSFDLRQDELSAEWIGALRVSLGGYQILLGAPLAAVSRLGPSVDALDAVILPTGHLRLLDGLVPLLASRTTDRPLTVVSLVGEPRSMALVDAFSRGWPHRAQPEVDVFVAGQPIALGPTQLHTRPARAGEPHGDAVSVVAGCGVRLTAAGQTIAFLPAVAPSRGWRAFVGQAELAVVEVGVRPWPPGQRPWRHDTASAISAAREARRLWLVGDDGRPLDVAQA